MYFCTRKASKVGGAHPQIDPNLVKLLLVDLVVLVAHALSPQRVCVRICTFCTSKASTFVLVKPGKSHRSRRPRADSTALLRQNVYFCTSKARKLRTSRKSGPVITMASLSPSSRHVRYQHLHFSTSKASKLSTNTRLVRIALFENATLEVSVLVLSY
jgi:hypothetical protein